MFLLQRHCPWTIRLDKSTQWKTCDLQFYTIRLGASVHLSCFNQKKKKHIPKHGCMVIFNTIYCIGLRDIDASVKVFSYLLFQLYIDWIWCIILKMFCHLKNSIHHNMCLAIILPITIHVYDVESPVAILCFFFFFFFFATYHLLCHFHSSVSLRGVAYQMLILYITAAGRVF